MQLEFLHKSFDKLQLIHGAQKLKAIYGAGCVKNPQIMFVFMNPTARNISADINWGGLRAPWLGTKNVWSIFYKLNLLSENFYKKTQEMKPEQWEEGFAGALYTELKSKKVFVTNLAKCTQVDARPLKNAVFKDYLDLLFKEIEIIKPQNIVSFGNQVSSILLSKAISVSDYSGTKNETLRINSGVFKVYPTYYPVGQGRRNMPIAIKRIKNVLRSLGRLTMS